MKAEENVPMKNAPVVNVTNGRVAHPKRWIAVLVQMNCEKKSAARLAKMGYETYVPTQSEMHRWSDRRKKIDRILIPMVLFVRIASNEDHWLRSQTFVHKMLALPGSDEARQNLPSTIPDVQIERLKFLLENADSEVTVTSNLKIGDAVRVASGPLKGLEGVVSDADERKSVVAFRINGLGYACVSVEKVCLELIS